MKHRIILTGLIVCGLLFFSAVGFAGEWEQKVKLPQLGDRAVGMWGLGVEAFNGKLYGFGGQDDLKPPGKFVGEYDPVRDAWDVKGKWQRGRFRISSAIVRGRIFAFGGTEDNFQAVPFVDEYDPKTDTWTPKADMPSPRMETLTAVVGGKIYVIGGADSFFFPSAAVEVYDPVSDTWEQKADMPNPRWGAGVFAARSKIYICGGAVDNTHQKYTDLTEEYDPKTDTWTPKAKMPLDYFDMSVSFVNSGKAYAIGGKTFDGNEKNGQNIEGWIVHWTVFEYDLDKNKWTSLKDQMPTPRGTLTTVVLNGKIYAVGGHGAGGPRREMEVYTPDGWPFPKAFAVSPQGKLAIVWGEIKQRR